MNNADKLNALFHDFFQNENLERARRRAKELTTADIQNGFVKNGYSVAKASLMTAYLKTGKGLQEALDAK